jgi:hypothetical protein
MPAWLEKEMREVLDAKIEEDINIDFIDLLGVPDNSQKVMLERRLREQKAMDLHALETKALQEANKHFTDGGLDALVRRDLNSKDEDLIRKMNILSDVIEIDRAPEFTVDFSSQFDPEILRNKLQKLHRQGFVSSEFYLENVIKMMYLNNADPEFFNYDRWSEYHDVPVKAIRDLMLHINYPVIVEHKVVGRLAFLDIPTPKTITDLNEENMRRFKERQAKQA